LREAGYVSAVGRKGYDDVVVVAPITTSYVRYSVDGAHAFAGRTLRALIDSAGISKAQIDGFCFASFTLAPDTVAGLTQHLGLNVRWLDQTPTGGASGIVCLRRALRAVQSGDASIVACVAADTNQIGGFGSMLEHFSRFTEDGVYPYGAGGPNGSFALLTAYYMKEYGATREDFGKLCVAQRENALRFPLALMKTPLTMQDYMNAPPIADPLCLYDCVMPCAGGEAFLVMSLERATQLGLPYARVLGTIERHNAFSEDPIQMRGGWVLDRDELYAQAGVTCANIDFVQTYDDYPVISLMQLEDLGFCAKGEGPDFVRQHTFTLDGSFPVNTSGGQLSVGQAGAAGGFMGLTEAVRQLTDTSLGAAVVDAKVALVSGYGIINYDRGLCTGAAIFARQGT
jgi:acetyl-CoA acetyltransferase